MVFIAVAIAVARFVASGRWNISVGRISAAIGREIISRGRRRIGISWGGEASGEEKSGNSEELHFEWRI